MMSSRSMKRDAAPENAKPIKNATRAAVDDKYQSGRARIVRDFTAFKDYKIIAVALAPPPHMLRPCDGDWLGLLRLRSSIARF